jgi:hypothetical protein
MINMITRPVNTVLWFIPVPLTSFLPAALVAISSSLTPVKSKYPSTCCRIRGADITIATENNSFFDHLDDSGFYCHSGIIRSIALGVHGKIETVKPGVPIHVQITIVY